MLHARRKRLEKLAEAEARGETFWTKKFSQQIRTRLWYAVVETSYASMEQVLGHARRLVMTDEGMLFLSKDGIAPAGDFYDYWFACGDDMMPTLLEAVPAAMEVLNLEQPVLFTDRKQFALSVNEILNEHRISYELMNGEMIEFESKEMHQAVVVPTLQLLAGRPELIAVETQYQNALKEISKDASADAITDAGTALQEMLTARGCEGNAIGPLLDSARKKGLLAPHDTPMGLAIGKLIEWVAADRSELGDSHKATQPSRDDAWLIVHVVGALILRLAPGDLRAPVH